MESSESADLYMDMAEKSSCHCSAPLEELSAHLTNTCRLDRHRAEANGQDDRSDFSEEQSVMLMSELPQVIS